MNAKWNWRAQREKTAFLALADGTVFHGYSVGAENDALGEVVFNTGMTGYQEILSDPSYSGQLVTMTCPEIGNTGINAADMESSRLFANGFILHEMNTPSNWRSEVSLEECLRRNAIPAIAGIDTRALTSKLRDQGTLKGYLAVSGKIAEQQAVRLAAEWGGLDGQDYAVKVSCQQPYLWDETGTLSVSWGIADSLPKADLKIVAYDFGIKWNILRSMRRNGMAVTVVPAKTSAADVLALKPHGVLLSNGPADPAAVTYAIENSRRLIGKVPLMGICLGHQILGIACGGRTCRLKFGHHGCNHPVKDLKTSRVEITSQNHNFTVDPDSLDPVKVEITHINLNDQTVEGIEHKQAPMFSVQYHPEACPGPHDPYYLFSRFRRLIGGHV
ncbi:MAG: glutamine-hydrolyzing carbamoyl-phosphate synthase small subunit [Verrucomicrobia bacterium]|nr:glutamine-hydrolyzing carbamoyl-phosphate synthase small subunit [Verrucomicrobiota bacterium]MCG2681857.1 glutamine-hydrolyzing carbamoyl-phosphate synthase small subunit [Kiritimatiellia bacterium]MBU4247737.1 glutamine-hydrolyzing carbamoyl-phosphate synthase small subunit [Verrucomicrobiota bacterium]MBU4291611.1 glutamine-hydrolyzing carbamoyl-phosphate synthase small subunit [Verrucomicrobiota bacterium]MBU4429572.1 glutamine-hydrolyzing carbamoyl-phosphate synthase small subunit [Verr